MEFCIYDICFSEPQWRFVLLQLWSMLIVIFCLIYKHKEYKLGATFLLIIAQTLGFYKNLPSSSLIPKTLSGAVRAAFADVDASSPFQVKAVDLGTRGDLFSYIFLFDAVKSAGTEVSKAGCTNCCVNIDRPNYWSGHMIITTDGTDPSSITCDLASQYFACRRSDSGNPDCDLFLEIVDDPTLCTGRIDSARTDAMS